MGKTYYEGTRLNENKVNENKALSYCEALKIYVK